MGLFTIYLLYFFLPRQSDEEIHELCALIYIFVSYYLMLGANEEQSNIISDNDDLNAIYSFKYT